MLAGIYIAAAGMEAQQQASTATANNIANLDTPGYKPVRVRFRDLLYSGGQAATGAGAAAEQLGRKWGQGPLHATGRSLDLAIDGSGFFAVRRPNGSTALTRDGAFAIDARGRLTTNDGNLIVPGVTVPPGSSVQDLRVTADGTATVRGAAAGRIQLVDVPAPDRLRADGGGLFAITPQSGPAGTARAQVHQGQLEGSTAQVTELLGGQHTFQALAQVIKIEDQMMSVANQLRQ